MKKMMLVDGNSILNRAFYGLSGEKLLITSNGSYTNAVLGFLNILFKYLAEEKPEYLCVAFDLKAPTFRHKEFDGYKAKRKPMPMELVSQIPLIKEVLDAMLIAREEVEGFEADDIIGTWANIAEHNDLEAVIVTGDRDSYQLITKTTRVKLPRTKGGKTETDEYGFLRIMEEYNIEPKQFIDLKGLMGDSSDNIPGVAGVGEKTALKLIQEYQNLETIYDNIESIKETLKTKLKTDKEMAFLSRKLATINKEVPIERTLQDLLRKDFDPEILTPVLNRLEFKSIIQKLGLENINQSPKVELPKITTRWLLSVDEIENELNGLSLGDKISIAYMQKNVDKGPEVIVLHTNRCAYILEQHAFKITIFKQLTKLSKKGIKIIGHDVKELYVWLAQHGIFDAIFTFDTMLASYILDSNDGKYNLSRIAAEYIGMQCTDLDVLLKEDKKGRAVSMNEIGELLATSASIIDLLYEELQRRLDESDQNELYFQMELPLIQTLAEMECYGFRVDTNELKRISTNMEQKIEQLSAEIYKLSGEEFNLNSTKQLGTILFEKLQLKSGKKTKTGYSTDVEVLEKLQGDHPIIEKIMEYRQYVKLKSTYADGLLNLVNQGTGRIHSKFQQTIASTGRISSIEPNLQNIPIKMEIGREIRKAFIPENENYLLVDADYSQVELRVLAHITNDENMLEAFKNGEDIHTMTASKVFGVPICDVTPLLRSRAKAVNFGIVYGIGEYSLAKDIGISRKEARQYIDGYLDQYPKVREYMKNIIELAKKEGYVRTIANRRRNIPEISSSNFNVRSFGERLALNTPIQGTAADIIKIAMVRVRDLLRKGNYKSKLILQVHDELIVETLKSELEDVEKILRESMEQAIKLSVPLTVELRTGKSWYETK